MLVLRDGREYIIHPRHLLIGDIYKLHTDVEFMVRAPADSLVVNVEEAFVFNEKNSSEED